MPSIPVLPMSGGEFRKGARSEFIEDTCESGGKAPWQSGLVAILGEVEKSVNLHDVPPRGVWGVGSHAKTLGVKRPQAP